METVATVVGIVYFFGCVIAGMMSAFLFGLLNGEVFENQEYGETWMSIILFSWVGVAFLVGLIVNMTNPYKRLKRKEDKNETVPGNEA